MHNVVILAENDASPEKLNRDISGSAYLAGDDHRFGRYRVGTFVLMHGSMNVMVGPSIPQGERKQVYGLVDHGAAPAQAPLGAQE
ncbi:hypothetical protein [Desulfoglaeba alkanexedens]|uniref:Uncharacterized protein n=1 Tax=Desulfoglaeba alkanexedens ALDC TaxID=980445 RepID=A0A4P8L699_9BACT|nr:hypothetical protein [Desulfoglaeba alkanexedens]QCQ22302.1 hypothetical protein FDQ92_09095 [Desulfoglaeba alkanexedens ALDC]